MNSDQETIGPQPGAANEGEATPDQGGHDATDHVGRGIYIQKIVTGPVTYKPNADEQEKRGRNNIGWLAAAATTIATIAIAIGTFLLVRSEDTASERQLRAYVYVDPGAVYHVGDSSVAVGYVRIGNSGQTYAKDTVRWIGIKIARPSDLNDPAFFEKNEIREDGRLVVSPAAPHSIYRVTPSTIAKPEGDLRIYVFGTVRYADIFGERRFTEFCFAYYGELAQLPVPEPNKTVPGYDGSQARYCEQHNRAD